jgi:Leucine-rich repeat (LRR) protein
MGAQKAKQFLQAANSDSEIYNQIEDIVLDNTPLKHIDEGMYENFKNLKYLGLENTSLKTISEDSFKNLEKLEILNISKNKPKIIPDRDFKKTSNLIGLYIQKNVIIELKRSNFSDIPKLQNLHFSFNDDQKHIEEFCFINLHWWPKKLHNFF